MFSNGFLKQLGKTFVENLKVSKTKERKSLQPNYYLRPNTLNRNRIILSQVISYSRVTHNINITGLENLNLDLSADKINNFLISTLIIQLMSYVIFFLFQSHVFFYSFLVNTFVAYTYYDTLKILSHYTSFKNVSSISTTFSIRCIYNFVLIGPS